MSNVAADSGYLFSYKRAKMYVELDLNLPLQGRVKTVKPVRMVKGSDGWVVSEAGIQ